jgi:hypothetical protein
MGGLNPGEPIDPSSPSAGLPAGAATEAKQDDQIAQLISLNAKDYATEATLATRSAEATQLLIKAILDNLTFTGGDLNTTATISSLPAGLATEATLALIKAQTDLLSFSAGGNLKTSIFDASTGARGIVDNNGAQKVGTAKILAGDVFGSISPGTQIWQFDTTGSGANVTQAGNERLETGTTANSSQRMQTNKKARFMLSQFNIFHGGIGLPNLTNPDYYVRFGAFNPIGTSNGVYFEVLGGATPQWNVVTVKNGVATAVPQGSWTGAGAGSFNPNPGLAVYEIIYNAGSVFFFQGPNLLHVQTVANLGQTYASSYHFNVGVEIENINGNTTNNTVDVYAVGIYRLGDESGETISRAFTVDTIVKEGAGFLASISLSRNGSAGGAGRLDFFDGTSNAGIFMGRIDIGGDGFQDKMVKSTFTNGLFIEITGSGTNVATVTFE